MKRLFTAFILLLALGFAGIAGAEVHATKHFRIHYQTNKTTNAYAKSIGNHLEKARKEIFNTLKFKRPSWMKNNFIDVTIKNLENQKLGVAHYPSIFSNPHLEINLKKKLENGDLLKATCAHEFFHIVQYGYAASPELNWLYESTATWVEDKVFNPSAFSRNKYGYLFYLNDWEKLSGEFPLSSRYENMEYAAAFFLQYLSERTPGTNKIVTDMWDEVGKGERDPYAAMSLALGDSAPWGQQTRYRLGEFAVTNLVRAPFFQPHYSLKGLFNFSLNPGYPFQKMPPLLGNARVWLTGAFHPPYVSDRLKMGKRERNSLTPDYIEISSYRNGWVYSSDLIVAVYNPPDAYWTFHLVKKPRTGAWSVQRFPDAAPGQWAQLKVENYPSSNQLFLTAIEAPGNKKRAAGAAIRRKVSYNWVAVVANPPVVKSFKVMDPKIKDKKPLWELTRTPVPEKGGWKTRVTAGSGIPLYPEESIELLFETNHGMLAPPVLQIGEQSFHSRQISFDNNKKFKTTVPLKKLTAFLKKGSTLAWVPVRIEGKDVLLSRFDADPKTPPYLKFEGNQAILSGWEGNASDSPGGMDLLSSNKLPLLATAPYLRQVLVFQIGEDGTETSVYEASWGRPMNAREKRKLMTVVGKLFDPSSPAKMVLIFDRPVEIQEVLLGKLNISLKRDHSVEDLIRTSLMSGDIWSLTKDEYREESAKREGMVGSAYSGIIPVMPDASLYLKVHGKLPIKVRATSRSGFQLDANPGSLAHFDLASRSWAAYESLPSGPPGSVGGPDVWHSLVAQKSGWVEKNILTGSRRNIELEIHGNRITARIPFAGVTLDCSGVLRENTFTLPRGKPSKSGPQFHKLVRKSSCLTCSINGKIDITSAWPALGLPYTFQDLQGKLRKIYDAHENKDQFTKPSLEIRYFVSSCFSGKGGELLKLQGKVDANLSWLLAKPEVKKGAKAGKTPLAPMRPPFSSSPAIPLAPMQPPAPALSSWQGTLVSGSPMQPLAPPRPGLSGFKLILPLYSRLDKYTYGNASPRQLRSPRSSPEYYKIQDQWQDKMKIFLSKYLSEKKQAMGKDMPLPRCSDDLKEYAGLKAIPPTQKKDGLFEELIIWSKVD